MPANPTLHQHVNVPALGIRDAEVVDIIPPSVVGGEVRYRIRYFEAALNAWREYGVWRCDVDVVATAERAEAA